MGVQGFMRGDPLCRSNGAVIRVPVSPPPSEMAKTLNQVAKSSCSAHVGTLLLHRLARVLVDAVASVVAVVPRLLLKKA